MTLKWTAPDSDGGAPIEKYILQKKDRFKQDWEPAAEIAGDQTTGVIPNLKEKEELQFRVVAVNKAGLSPASEPTKIHIVKHKSRKYLLNALSVLMCARTSQEGVSLLRSKTEDRPNQLEERCCSRR